MDKANGQSLIAKITRSGAFVLIGIGVALLVYARFNAVNGVVLPFLQKAAHPEFYGLDDYLRQSIVPESSPMFALLGRLGTDLTQPSFVITAYLLVTAAAAAALWRILDHAFGVRDLLERFTLLFALAFADFKIITLNKSSWIDEHNFSFTFIGAALRLWVLAFLLEGRVVVAAALLIPINLISFKVGWPFVGFVALTLIASRNRAWLPWALMMLSLVAPGLAALHSAHLSHADATFVYDALIGLHTAEDDPFAGPLVQLPLFLGGVAFGFWRLASLPQSLRTPLGAILVGSVLIWAAGGVYFHFLAASAPLPIIVLLSPARAMELAGLVIYLLALLWALQTHKLVGVERVMFLLALMILKVTPDGKWVKISFLLAAASIALSGFRRLVCRRGWSVAQVGKSLRAPFGLAAMAPFIGLFFALNLGGVRTTYRVDKTLGFYDSSMSPAILALLRAEAEQGGDKRLLVISPAKNWTPTEWQYLAGKSGITGDPYYLSQPDQIRAQQARNVVAADIAAGIGKGQVKAETAIDLARLDATLIAPVEAMPALHGWRVVLDGGDWKEFEPPTALSTDE